MPSKKDPAEITVLKCAKCGEEVSGPDADDVKATMARHMRKDHRPFRGAGK